MVRSGAKAERWRDAHQREAASLISVGLDLRSVQNEPGGTP